METLGSHGLEGKLHREGVIMLMDGLLLCSHAHRK